MNTFLAAYVEAALWSSTDESTPAGGYPMDLNYGPEDLAPETLAKFTTDCEKFVAANDADLHLRNVAYGAHDFWLTRNGHGAGFWDGDWPEPAGERLTQSSKTFGECCLYLGDDGKIYC